VIGKRDTSAPDEKNHERQQEFRFERDGKTNQVSDVTTYNCIEGHLAFKINQFTRSPDYA
jgi:hypothetical protein